MPLALLTLVVAPLMAAAPEEGSARGYEEALVAWGLAQHSREVEPSPEGKRLEEVLVAAEDVIAESDPYPGFLNIVHVRTREQVIRREALMEPGALYSAELAEETARNLRKLGIFSAVRVVPVKGQTPGGVALLIITKDLWSLRLNQTWDLVGSFVRYLRLQGTEKNFLGLNQQLAVDFLLRPDTMSIGETYINRRVGGSRWYFGQSAFLILGRVNLGATSRREILAMIRFLMPMLPSGFRLSPAAR